MIKLLINAIGNILTLIYQAYFGVDKYKKVLPQLAYTDRIPNLKIENRRVSGPESQDF